ncbi:hypothetical protein LCGC14_0956420 [marine sediment metagenome]|uniref:Uncharacterized protein n=1 Tax=marine sediment metagenome TaxID=412755 RepID=A0A0F9QZ47_9ZZZZ
MPHEKKKLVQGKPKFKLRGSKELLTRSELKTRAKTLAGERDTGERTTKRRAVTLPTIEAKRKEPERKKLTGALGVLTSPKTTGVLAGTLAAVGGAGLLAGAIGTKLAAKPAQAVITRFASRHQLDTLTGKLVARGTRQTQRAFVGRPGTHGKLIDKIFRATPNVKRFATNQKSTTLTKSLATKAGLGLGTASLLIGAIGSYPFAGFIKEEALQTLGFAFKTAEENKDIEGMENALADVEEILNAAPEIMDKIPYANVLNQLTSFFAAANTKLDNDRRRLETLRGEQETGETAFQAERKEADVQARERQLEERERDAEYFALVREGRFEEAEELLQSELKGGN